jgi:hypothetical protein
MKSLDDDETGSDKDSDEESEEEGSDSEEEESGGGTPVFDVKLSHNSWKFDKKTKFFTWFIFFLYF